MTSKAAHAKALEAARAAAWEELKTVSGIDEWGGYTWDELKAHKHARYYVVVVRNVADAAVASYLAALGDAP